MADSSMAAQRQCQYKSRRVTGLAARVSGVLTLAASLSQRGRTRPASSARRGEECAESEAPRIERGTEKGSRRVALPESAWRVVPLIERGRAL